MELRGLPSYIGIPPFLRRFGLSGTSLGTLRGFFFFAKEHETTNKSIYLSIYQKNARRPQERRALSVANNR